MGERLVSAHRRVHLDCLVLSLRGVSCLRTSIGEDARRLRLMDEWGPSVGLH